MAGAIFADGRAGPAWGWSTAVDTEEFADVRVLVVDDDIDTATSLTYLLQLFGCKTAAAFGATMAYRMAQLLKPTMVFLDLDMPGGDGCEALQTLREIDAGLANALFVCLTAHADPEVEQRCLAAGFERFVAKPIGGEQLVSLLQEGRERSAQRSRRAESIGNDDA